MCWDDEKASVSAIAMNGIEGWGSLGRVAGS